MAVKTKRKILQKALSLFQERGYTNVTIDDICAATGITRSTFYYHYKTKDELLDSVYADYDGKYDPEKMADILLSDNRWDQVWSLLSPSMDYTMEIGPALESWLMAISLTEKRKVFSSETALSAVNVIEKIIAAGQSSGQFRNHTDAAELATLVVQKIILGNTFYWCIGQGPFDLKERNKKDIIAILDVRPELL